MDQQSTPMYLPRFFLKQKLALTVNRFEVWNVGPTGEPTTLLAFAEQKRFAFKEQVTFYADETRSRAVFSFKARTVMDLNGVYDVLDEAGRPLATFNRNFAKSLWRTTFHVQAPGYEGTGQERDAIIAFLRRFTDIDFLPVHFDYADASGRPMLSIERAWALRDKYDITVPDPRMDFRVAAALAVAMDVLTGR